MSIRRKKPKAVGKKAKAKPRKTTGTARAAPLEKEPYELIYEETLKELRATRKATDSAAWELAVGRESEGVQDAARARAIDVETAIRELENAELVAIRDKLIDNESSLRAGIARLSRARERLENVQDVLEKVAKVLEVVGKVVVFVGA
jgi:predicted urease superfamily metal-dependent hydrolase